MRVYINGKFLTQRITGVQRYARELIKELDMIVKENEIMILIPPNTKNDLILKNIKVKKIGKLTGNMWEQFSLFLYIKKHNGRLLNLCNSAPILYPDIITIHDVKIKARPEDFSGIFSKWYKFMFKNIIPKSNLIITVSNFSKSEILRYYEIKSEKIKVICNAWQHYEKIEYDENTLDRYRLLKDSYYFAMGSLEPNKNFKWIAELAKRNSNEIFAVAGSINEKIFADGLGFECPDNMKLLGYVTDNEAKVLMRDCKAFLFPSFYEGFGIPPLEALAAGAKKLIVSDTCVMHEIFEDSANYIDHTNYNYEISFHKLIEVESKKILSKYSWEESAKLLYDMISVYK